MRGQPVVGSLVRSCSVALVAVLRCCTGTVSLVARASVQGTMMPCRFILPQVNLLAATLS
jgi:hypothetical protein